MTNTSWSRLVHDTLLHEAACIDDQSIFIVVATTSARRLITLNNALSEIQRFCWRPTARKQKHNNNTNHTRALFPGGQSSGGSASPSDRSPAPPSFRGRVAGCRWDFSRAQPTHMADSARRLQTNARCPQTNLVRIRMAQ